MSANKSDSKTYKYQSKTKVTHTSVPIIYRASSTTQNKVGRFSSYRPAVSSRMTEDLSAYYLYNYIFQDRPDETNIVFFDSNLRKYRTRSSAKTQQGSSLSKSYNIKTNLNSLKKDSNSLNKNTYSLKESKGLYINQKKNINTINERKKENLEVKNEAQERNINYNIGRKDSEERAEIIRQLKKEKDELLGQSSSDYSSAKKKGDNLYDEKSNNQIKKSNLNINTDITQKKSGNENNNMKNLKGSNIKKSQNEQIINQKKSITKNDKKSEGAKLNKASEQQQEKQNINQKAQTKKNATQQLGSSNLNESSQNKTKQNINQKSPTKKTTQSIDDSKKKQVNQTKHVKQNINQKSPVKKNAQLEGSNQINSSQSQENQDINQKKDTKKSIKGSENQIKIQSLQSLKKTNIIHKNPLKQSTKKEESQNNTKSGQKNIENAEGNKKISEENQIYSKFMKQDIPQSLKNNQYQMEMDAYQKNNMNNMNRNNNEQLRESNVSVVKKQEEKTIVLVPGQTIEPKNITETFENPVEEIIQNPDGTTTSLIKQTKIITTTQNIPIEENKIKSLEGAPELPMIKQYITYEYKTVTTLKENGDQSGQGLNGQNQFSSSNLMNQSSPMKYGQHGFNQYGNERQGQQGYNQFEDNYNPQNFNDQRNINSNSQFGNEKLGGNKNFYHNQNVQNNNSGNEQENENIKSNLSPDVLPKGFKSEEEVENFLDEINQKGENATPEEKQKRLKCLEEIFNNIGKGGENSEENLQKLSELLSNMNEKDRQEILTKLNKGFPKNGELLKKLTYLVQNNINKKSKLYESGKKVENLEENELLGNSKRYGESGFNKGLTGSTGGIVSNLRDFNNENIEVKGVSQLKFDGLFLEISKYNNEHREKNPFEGPSPYCKFYKDRRIKIKNKIQNMASVEIDYEGNEDMKLENKKEKKD